MSEGKLGGHENLLVPVRISSGPPPALTMSGPLNLKFDMSSLQPLLMTKPRLGQHTCRIVRPAGCFILWSNEDPKYKDQINFYKYGPYLRNSCWIQIHSLCIEQPRNFNIPKRFIAFLTHKLSQRIALSTMQILHWLVHIPFPWASYRHEGTHTGREGMGRNLNINFQKCLVNHTPSYRHLQVSLL